MRGRPPPPCRGGMKGLVGPAAVDDCSTPVTTSSPSCSPSDVTAVRTHVDEPQPGKKVTRKSVANFGYQVSGAIFSRDGTHIASVAQEGLIRVWPEKA